MKLGLKLWSINDTYIHEAKRLYEENVYDYIELYIVPDSFQKFNYFWKELGVPFVVHAPHFMHGVNPGKREKHVDSFKKAQEAISFADALDAQYIIFHPGIEGTKENTVEFFKSLDDERVLVENKPYYAIMDGLICNGNNPEEIKYIIENARVGFCFDIGHAVCSACTRKIDYLEYVSQFLMLNPVMCHLTDKKVDEELDQHLHFGSGSIDLREIINRIGLEAMVTIETMKDSQDNLNDFVEDVKFLRKLQKNE